MRGEAKYLERKLFPLTKFSDPGNRYLRWIIIFIILPHHPIVAALISRIQVAGFTLDGFAKEMQTFYGDDSSAVHGVRLPDIPLAEMIKILSANERKPNPDETMLLTIVIESNRMVLKALNSTAEGKPI